MQVFTSYSRRDTETVDRIVESIEDTGIDVWIDREDIKAGNRWRIQIVEAIDTCAAFVLMLSPNSVASDNVRKEIDLAQDSGRTIFPVMLDPVKLPAAIRYQLAGEQLIDVQMLGFEKAVAQLIETIKEHIQKIKSAVEQTTRQAELVIQGIDLASFSEEKQEQLLDFISKLTSADRSQLSIETMTAGSLHVFMNMPAKSAFELKTLALNRDKRFKQFGIKTLRLAGDAKFVNISLGILTHSPTLSLLTTIWLRIPSILSPIFGVTVGKLLSVLVAAAVIGWVGGSIPGMLAPLLIPSPTPTNLATKTTLPALAPSLTQTPSPTSTPTQTPSATTTRTPEPTSTQTPSSTPTPTYVTLTGVVLAEQLACRYGPGQPYLSKFGLIKGNKVQVLGRADTGFGTWVYVQFGELLCWINANPRFVELSGDVSGLEPYYPEKAPLLLFDNPNFPPPRDVKAERRGDQVSISWTGYILAPGDREDLDRPVYLVEAWVCQAGKIVFIPLGAFEEGISVRDEAGCSEPSHGQVFVAHKDGYVGPVAIPWPPDPTPTP